MFIRMWLSICLYKLCLILERKSSKVFSCFLNSLLQRLALRCNFLEEAGSCLQAENVVTDCLVTDKGKWYMIFLLHCVIMLYFFQKLLSVKKFCNYFFFSTTKQYYGTRSKVTTHWRKCLYTLVSWFPQLEFLDSVCLFCLINQGFLLLLRNDNVLLVSCLCVSHT